MDFARTVNVVLVRVLVGDSQCVRLGVCGAPRHDDDGDGVPRARRRAILGVRQIVIARRFIFDVRLGVPLFSVPSPRRSLTSPILTKSSRTRDDEVARRPQRVFVHSVFARQHESTHEREP